MPKGYKGLRGRAEVIDAGAQFGAATVIAETTPGKDGRRFSVRCECGSIRTVYIGLLQKVRRGASKGRCRKCAHKKR